MSGSQMPAENIGGAAGQEESKESIYALMGAASDLPQTIASV